MKFRIIALAGLLLMTLSACGSSAKFDVDKAIAYPGSKDVPLTYRAELKNPSLNLNDPAAVAKALGITLNGKPDQFLYKIVMRYESGSAIVTRNIPVRVDNISDGSKLIYNSRK